jgi:negative regulator of genetic competence, sporulation and motility
LNQTFTQLKIKEELYNACKAFLAERRSNVHDIMVSNQMALENESKSSAGDKHETGRAMLHLEMEKASQQVAVIAKMQEIMDKIDFSKSSDHIKLGSLIITDNGKYYLSISAGLIRIGSEDYFALSPSSPAGNLFLGKRKGSAIHLSEKQIRILDVQ